MKKVTVSYHSLNQRWPTKITLASIDEKPKTRRLEIAFLKWLLVFFLKGKEHNALLATIIKEKKKILRIRRGKYENNPTRHEFSG